MMVYLKGAWSHDGALNRPTDGYRFVSLLQCSTVYRVPCRVVHGAGYVLWTVAVRMLQREHAAAADSALPTLFGLLRPDF